MTAPPASTPLWRWPDVATYLQVTQATARRYATLYDDFPPPTVLEGVRQTPAWDPQAIQDWNSRRPGRYLPPTDDEKD